MSKQTCRAAIAYLKPVIPSDDPAPLTRLPRDDTPVMKDVGSGLLVAYLVDAGDAFDYIQYRDLDADSLSETDLHEIGVNNLSQLTSTTELRVARHGNIFSAFLDGNFEASLILVDDLWRESFRQFIDGEYLVAIPNRDILAFCDRSSEAGRAELLQVIERLEGSTDHPLSKGLFVRGSTDWHTEAAVM